MNIHTSATNEDRRPADGLSRRFGHTGSGRTVDFAGIARFAFLGVVLLALLLVLVRLLKMAFANSRRGWQLLPGPRPQEEEKPGMAADDPEQAPGPSPGSAGPAGAGRPSSEEGKEPEPAPPGRRRRRETSSRRPFDRLLLAAEIFAVAFVLVAGTSLWYTLKQLNGTYRILQQSDPAILPTVMAAAGPQTEASEPQKPEPKALPPLYVAKPAQPTPIPTSTPVTAIGQAPPPTPTAVPPEGLAQRIQIPAIKVDTFVFPDGGPSTLKMGVVQYGERIAPGAAGNIVLAAHNDIFGAVFRNLDRLAPGDSLVLYEDRRQYVYRVRKSMIVKPDATWVMNQTKDPTLTLISCYPFLIDSQRIVVVGELVE